MKKSRKTVAEGLAAGRPARGRKPIFRREHVIEAALALMDRDGHAALSMRGIAACMGTGVATLYNYFGSLAEVNDAIAIALLNEIPLLDANDTREARRQLKDRTMAYADVVARHPDFERMVGPLADQQIMRLLDSALRVMLDAGVDIERAGVSWSVLQSLAQTHAASSRRLDSAKRSDTRKKFKELDAVLTLANTGVFKASRDEWFHRVLDLTIDRMLPELKIKTSKR
jgi:AcrR family transcriptional regulator